MTRMSILKQENSPVLHRRQHAMRLLAVKHPSSWTKLIFEWKWTQYQSVCREHQIRSKVMTITICQAKQEYQRNILD